MRLLRIDGGAQILPGICLYRGTEACDRHHLKFQRGIRSYESDIIYYINIQLKEVLYYWWHKDFNQEGGW